MGQVEVEDTLSIIILRWKVIHRQFVTSFMEDIPPKHVDVVVTSENY